MRLTLGPPGLVIRIVLELLRCPACDSTIAPNPGLSALWSDQPSLTVRSQGGHHISIGERLHEAADSAVAAEGREGQRSFEAIERLACLRGLDTLNDVGHTRRRKRWQRLVPTRNIDQLRIRAVSREDSMDAVERRRLVNDCNDGHNDKLEI